MELQRPRKWLGNPGLATPIEETFDNWTSPEVRWLVRRSGLTSIPDTLPTFRTMNGLYAALGINLGGWENLELTSSASWNYLLSRSGELRSVVDRPGAFFARDEPWPLEHPVLDRVSPLVWMGSYHPFQPKHSPLLSLKGLDELTAWALNLTDTVDHEQVVADLALAQTLPGFRIWTERINILPAFLPAGADGPTTMEARFEVLDAPLRDPLLSTPRNQKAFRPDLDLDVMPRIACDMIPFSNSKSWQALEPRPNHRWSLQTQMRGKPSLKNYQRCAPYLVPKGTKHEVEVAGAYFPSVRAACFFFRIPYETVKTRIGRGYDLETALNLTPCYFYNSNSRATSYKSHWHRLYRRVDSK